MPASFAESRERIRRIPRQTLLPFPRRRAEPPHAPAPTAAVLKARAERTVYLRERECTESRSTLRGLTLLAAIALAVSLFRAGADRAFFAGWWRQW